MLVFAWRMFSGPRARLAQRMRLHGRSGSALIEFAMVAPVFLLLMFAIIETSILYFAQSTLQFATDNAARLVRTGQVQASAMTKTAFRNQICGSIAPLLACNGNLQVDMQAYTGFGGANFTDPLDTDGNLKPGLNNYQPGTSSSVVLVRVFYTWSVITPLLTPFLVNMSDDRHLLIGTSAFRNEPF